MKLNSRIAVLTAGLILIAGLTLFSKQVQAPQVSTKTLIIGKTTINVELAQTASQLEKGLSGRKSLGKNDGMLFVFSNSARYTFWMKDMKFALDFIWINDGRVVDLTENVSAEPGIPDNQLKLYTPKVPVAQVLEVNAGFVKENKISIGETVTDN